MGLETVAFVLIMLVSTTGASALVRWRYSVVRQRGYDPVAEFEESLLRNR